MRSVVTFAVGCLLIVGSLCAATHVTILGDSVAHGAGDESGRGIAGNLASLLGARVTDAGVNGARTLNVLRLLHTPGVRKAVATSDAVVVSIGGNDLYGDSLSRFLTVLWPQRAMTRTIDRITVIVARIRTLNPSARIYLLGRFDPYRTRFLDQQVASWDSRLIARFARDTTVDVVRIADLFAFAQRLSSLDHFHPGAVGYALIAQRIASTFGRSAVTCDGGTLRSP